jgi:hypothetical protein
MRGVATTLFKMAPPLEREIQRSILDYLITKYHDRAWRNSVGQAVFKQGNGQNRFVQFGKVGMSDIFLCLPPHGRMVAIEVKRPGLKPTQAQEEFLDMINNSGGLGFVATCLEDVIEKGI